MSIILLALVVRLGAIAATPHIRIASDPSDYRRHARSIADGRGYPRSSIAPPGPTAIRPPAFPYLLALVYAVSSKAIASRAVQALLGTACVALIGLIAFRLWGRTVGLLAAAFAAVFPPLVIDGITFLSEPLFVVFELAAVLAMLQWRASARLRWTVCAGILVGLGLLTRANAAAVLIPLAVAAGRGGSWRVLRTYRAPALLVATALVVIAPWTIRNAVELHAFIPVSDQDGYTLVGTYNPTSLHRHGEWIVATKDPHVARLVNAHRRLGEANLDAALRTYVRRFVFAHPTFLADVALHNTLRLFNLGGGAFERHVANGDYALGSDWVPIMVYGLFPFRLLACVGACTRAARDTARWFWAIPVLMLGTIMVLAGNRMRAPIDPFIVMLAALGALSLVRHLQRGQAARLPATQ